MLENHPRVLNGELLCNTNIHSLCVYGYVFVQCSIGRVGWLESLMPRRGITESGESLTTNK